MTSQAGKSATDLIRRTVNVQEETYRYDNAGNINKKVVCLHPGLVLDRFGADRGKIVSPQGIPFENRALYPRTAKTPYSIFEVVKPIDVKAGEIAPWFNKPGGGIQFLLPKSVEQLLNDGLLKRVLIYK